MKTCSQHTKRFKQLSAVTLLIGFVTSGCDISSFSTTNGALNPDDTFIVGQIIGESVSENQEGLLSTFQEAFAIPTSTTLIVGPSLLSTQNFTDLVDYQYTYESSTGQHWVSFYRESSHGTSLVESRHTVMYLFVDRSGNPLSDPDAQRDHIEAVEYKATRIGKITDSTKTSQFTRTDHLFMDGLSSGSNTLTIDGYHSGDGSYSFLSPDSVLINREYLIDINFLDIRIDKATVQTNRNFRTGVFGAFSYETTIRQRANGDEAAKVVNGTIELNGDGTALLRFRDQPVPLRFQLGNGRVYQRNEFESRVVQVVLNDSEVMLTNGQRIKITEETRILPSGDFRSLSEVSNALSSGLIIKAKGVYVQPNNSVNLWIAESIVFELESNEFQDHVASVDLLQNSFTLRNGDVFFIVNRSQIRIDGKIVKTLEAVASALIAGKDVDAEGTFFVDRSTGQRNISKVEFEFDDDDDD